MRWRSVLLMLIWAGVIFLLVFPTACQAWVCGRASVPLVILLGIIGMVLALSEAAQVRRKEREKLFGVSNTALKKFFRQSNERGQGDCINPRDLSYERNIQRYKNTLGPIIDWLRARGKSWNQIIESSNDTGYKELGL